MNKKNICKISYHVVLNGLGKKRMRSTLLMVIKKYFYAEMAYEKKTQ